MEGIAFTNMRQDVAYYLDQCFNAIVRLSENLLGQWLTFNVVLVISA